MDPTPDRAEPAEVGAPAGDRAGDGGSPGHGTTPSVGGPLPAELRRPARSRLAEDRPDRAQVLAAHEAALDRGDPGYLDPATGLFVMTAATLWARGTCCDSGCRHCPFVQPR